MPRMDRLWVPSPSFIGVENLAGAAGLDDSPQAPENLTSVSEDTDPGREHL